MYIFIGLVISGIAASIGINLNLPLLFVPAGICFLVFWWRSLVAQRNSDKAHIGRINETDAQLRKEIETALYALTFLSGADENTKTSVVELLVEAGKHLGNPSANSRLYYERRDIINWNLEGLKLVKEAQTLIDQYVANQPSS
jgi:hypothetical protein